MTLITVQYEAGTQKSPQQTEITKPYFTDTTGVHFPDGKLSTLPPYASASTAGLSITGETRSVHAQKLTGAQAGNYTLFGTDTGLYVLKNGNIYNITPFADQTNVSLATDSLDTHNGTGTLDIHYTAHGLAVGDVIYLSGAEDVGGFLAAALNTLHVVTAIIGVDEFSVTMGTNAGSSVSGGGSNITLLAIRATILFSTNAIATTNLSPNLVITKNAHGLLAGQRIFINNSGAIGGISAASINKEFEIASVTTNTFTVTTDTNATSTATGGNGASICTQIAAGNTDQGAASGYGAGIYGENAYGSGGYSSSSQAHPRIWSFSSFGNNVVMNAGDYIAGDGQKIYFWDGDTTRAPTVLLNAPDDCNWVGVVNNQVVALCGDHVKIGVTGDTGIVAWSGYGYNDFPVQRVWKMISMTVFGDKVAIIHTPNEHLLLRYVGGADIWDLADLFLEDGIIAPKASTVINSTAYWMGNRGFYGFDGSTVTKIKNDQNESWILENLNNGQNFKCFAMADTKNQQVYWYFPTGADLECNDYVIYNNQGHFTLGEMARTAAQQQMIDNQFLMVNSSELFRHFTTGAVTFDWHAKSSYSYVGEDLQRVVINRFIPDANMTGSATLTMFGLEYPQATETNFGDYTISSSTEHNTIRCAGKLTAWKLSGNAQFTMGGCKVNIGGQ